MAQCPRYERFRPDFMAPNPRIIASKGFVEIRDDSDQHDDDIVSQLDPDSKPMRYYESDKVLGHLYRAIDEHKFLAEMKRDRNRGSEQETLMPALWDYIQRSNLLVQWEHHRHLARNLKEDYEHELLKTLYEYQPSPHQPLTEQELFAGTILGRAGGASNRRLRDITNTMRERFEEILDFTTSRILHGNFGTEEDDGGSEALPRAIACLAVAMEEEGLRDRKAGVLRSFRYIAAGSVLREMRRWLGGGRGLGRLPRAS